MKKYQQKTFRFNNETIDDNYVDITVSVKEFKTKEDGDTYYEITYVNNYSNAEILNHHPLYKFENIRLHEGEYKIAGSDG